MQYLQLDISTGGDVNAPYVHVQLPVSLVSLHDAIVILVMVVSCRVGVLYPSIADWQSPSSPIRHTALSSVPSRKNTVPLKSVVEHCTVKELPSPSSGVCENVWDTEMKTNEIYNAVYST